MVTSGELDMGLIPSRAWDTEGVTSLRALNAPFLVDSDELLDEVVSDDESTDDLMAGLDKAGVVGLALFPDALRHPFALKEPLLGPEDYSGRVIRAAHLEDDHCPCSRLSALRPTTPTLTKRSTRAWNPLTTKTSRGRRPGT